MAPDTHRPFPEQLCEFLEEGRFGCHRKLCREPQRGRGFIGHLDLQINRHRAGKPSQHALELLEACGLDVRCLEHKLQAPGEEARDFMVQGPADHGIDGLVNLYGIESPGLTASLAIADCVADHLNFATIAPQGAG